MEPVRDVTADDVGHPLERLKEAVALVWANRWRIFAVTVSFDVVALGSEGLRSDE